MKKILTMLLVLTMVLGLFAGCGSDSDQTQPTATTVPTQATENQETTQATQETTQATDPQVTLDGKPVCLGEIKDGRYTNQYIGIGCELDASWQVYQAQDLQQLPENVQEMFAGTQMGQTLKEHPQIYDMLVDDPVNLRTMNVLYTSLSVSDQVIYAAMDDEAMLDMMLDTQRDLLIDSYAAAGIQATKLEKRTMTFLGQERVVLYLEATEQGVARYTVQVFDYTLGQYGVTITFTSYNEDQTQSMMDIFYAA